MATFFTDMNNVLPTLDDLLAQAERRRAAVDLRRREQIERGERTSNPNLEQASVLDDILRTRLTQKGLPQPRMSQLPTETRTLPGIGGVASYPTGERVVSGRYGSGIATTRATPDPNRKIDGVPAAQWFIEAANRQGADNKFARAETTGAVDELGRPQMRGIAIPKGSDAGTERVFAAMMNRKKQKA